MNTYWSRLLALFLLVLTLPGCGAAERNQLVGEWYKSDGNGGIQFFVDGTVVIFDKQKISGDYTVLDENNLRFDLGGVAKLAGPQVVGYELKDGILFLDEFDGLWANTFTRQDPGPIVEIAAQIEGGLNLSAGAKAAFSEFYNDKGKYPASNRQAGLAEAEQINYGPVRSVAIDDGRIVTTFDDDAHPAIAGKSLILTPNGSSNFIMDFSCGSSTIEPKHLPKECGGQSDGVPLARVESLSIRRALQGVREQVKEGISHATGAVEKFYHDHGAFPHGKPEAEQSLRNEISGQYIQAIDFAINGDISIAIEFDSELDTAIAGKTVFLDGSLVDGQIEWTCEPMDMNQLFLPDSCN